MDAPLHSDDLVVFTGNYCPQFGILTPQTLLQTFTQYCELVSVTIAVPQTLIPRRRWLLTIVVLPDIWLVASRITLTVFYLQHCRTTHPRTWFDSQLWLPDFWTYCWCPRTPVTDTCRLFIPSDRISRYFPGCCWLGRFTKTEEPYIVAFHCLNLMTTLTVSVRRDLTDCCSCLVYSPSCYLTPGLIYTVAPHYSATLTLWQFDSDLTVNDPLLFEITVMTGIQFIRHYWQTYVDDLLDRGNCWRPPPKLLFPCWPDRRLCGF